MPKVLRRKKSLAVINKDGIEISEIYCRKCCLKQPPIEFYTAMDKFLDSNGYLSICKDCISRIYVGFYNSTHDLRKAIYQTCKTINIIYSESAVQGVETQIKNKDLLEDNEKIFGWYKAKILSTMKGIAFNKMGELASEDLTFQYENTNIPSSEEIDFEGSQGVIDTWGNGFSMDDYRFLEKELANFKSTHKADSYAEIVLLKEVCYKLLEIQKARLSEHSTAAGVKELQTLMSTLAISPDKANQASAGKSMECFGKWIEEIEQFKPAEYFADKSIYNDIDDIEAYGEKYITTPLRSFILQSADYSTEELEKMLDDESLMGE